ncbi:MAG: peptidylprolyl isomerase [Candidatus Electrothrix aestuarii]|uniref:Peptidyl-prolyl cis-trans isomerase n=1 Tax=Candidatus Electrothrix aestuarii TaxID=3062594 RepID=A0AAU8LZ91_9BACT|nr:peptidylprolyl isomerase [Candidatus Electrothrix aestuarii]
MKITDGKTVIIDYTLSLKNGDIIETTRDDEPVTYVQGTGEVIEGLEQAVAGMEKGSKKDIVLPVDQAFGKHDPEALLEIPKNELPPESLVPETIIHANGPKGQTINGKVVEVKEETVIVDFNHPLAGQELYCAVHIIDVQ